MLPNYCQRWNVYQNDAEEKEMKYLVIVAVLLITVKPAHAYIDAGSGSYVLQMLMAGLLGLAFTVKLSWQRLKAFVGVKFMGKPQIEKRGHE